MAPASETQPAPEEPVVEETLVEEVSIDGMCGVY
jgi:mycofactocin precursor